METYTVLIPEVHYNHVKIDADSYEEALKAVLDGDGDCDYLEYSDTLEREEYAVSKEGDETVTHVKVDNLTTS